MRVLLQLLSALFRRPGLGSNARSEPLDTYLKPLILVLIALLVGPDLFALVELTTLLEVLGAAMFILAFAASGRLLLTTALGRARRLLLPAEYAWLLKIRGQPSAIVFGTMFAARNALLLALLGFMAYAGVAIFVGIGA